MKNFAMSARVGPPRQMGKSVKYDGEQRTICNDGDDLEN